MLDSPPSSAFAPNAGFDAGATVRRASARCCHSDRGISTCSPRRRSPSALDTLASPSEHLACASRRDVITVAARSSNLADTASRERPLSVSRACLCSIKNLRCASATGPLERFAARRMFLALRSPADSPIASSAPLMASPQALHSDPSGSGVRLVVPASRPGFGIFFRCCGPGGRTWAEVGAEGMLSLGLAGPPKETIDACIRSLKRMDLQLQLALLSSTSTFGERERKQASALSTECLQIRTRLAAACSRLSKRDPECNRGAKVVRFLDANLRKLREVESARERTGGAAPQPTSGAAASPVAPATPALKGANRNWIVLEFAKGRTERVPVDEKSSIVDVFRAAQARVPVGARIRLLHDGGDVTPAAHSCDARGATRLWDVGISHRSVIQVDISPSVPAQEAQRGSPPQPDVPQLSSARAFKAREEAHDHLAKLFRGNHTKSIDVGAFERFHSRLMEMGYGDPELNEVLFRNTNGNIDVTADWLATHVAPTRGRKIS